MSFKAALVVLLAIGVPAREDRSDDSKKVMDNLQGEWQMVKADFGGLPGPPMEKELPRFVINGNKITIVENKRNEEATFTVDLSKKPYAIDIRPEIKGGGLREDLLKGIFEVNRDTLKIAFTIPDFGGPPGGKGPPPAPERPTNFNPAPNLPVVSMTFQRARPK
jgi:uncharacterized protein (TIGR03067 family)